MVLKKKNVTDFSWIYTSTVLWWLILHPFPSLSVPYMLHNYICLGKQNKKCKQKESKKHKNMMLAFPVTSSSSTFSQKEVVV